MSVEMIALLLAAVALAVVVVVIIQIRDRRQTRRVIDEMLSERLKPYEHEPERKMRHGDV
jgi:uncharacterized protein YoxC